MINENAKISVLTPTYNDSESIEETFVSLLDQTYKTWEWIVINDGSTDDTEAHITRLIEKYGAADKCRYVYQENSDQLNALLHGLEYASGDYIFILHSDDLLPKEDFFERCVETMEKSPDADGIYGDLLLIDEKSNITGRQRLQYHTTEQTPALMLLWLGRNLYSDCAFHRGSVFRTSVKYNYLIWNMPLWLDMADNKVNMLNYINASFPVLKYRVHGGNYINNELGKMNVINGELRTAVELMKHYDIPQYGLQYFLFRTMNKLLPDKEFKVRYSVKPSVEPYKIVAFIVGKRYLEGADNNMFLSSLLNFYKLKSERELIMPDLKDVKVYYGKDVRLFNKRLLEGKLEPFYVSFLNEMKHGFGRIVVKDEEDAAKVKDIAKFLCIGGTEVVVRR